MSAPRLAWQRPAHGVPRWAQVCFDALNASGALRCTWLPGGGAGGAGPEDTRNVRHDDNGAGSRASPSAASRAGSRADAGAGEPALALLCLDAAGATTAKEAQDAQAARAGQAATAGPQARPASRCWLLTDARGRPLDASHPLLDDITSGRGLALLLWQRAGPGAAWLPLRRLHLGVPAAHGRAIARLPAALAQLLEQASRDVALGQSPVAGSGSGSDSGSRSGPDSDSGSGSGPGWGGLPASAPPAAGQPANSPAAPDLQPALPPTAALRAWWRLRGHAHEALARHRARWTRERWRIGVVDAPLTQLLEGGSLPPVRWLEAPPGPGYWADPMAHPGAPELLFCEYFDEHSGIGRIEGLRLDAQDRVVGRETLPLGGGRHASFPLVVQLDGRWLGLVETGARRECVLHEVDAAGRWRPLATLLHDVAAADPALFAWQGRYWLAYTDVDRGEADNLCLLHAPALEGPWQAHANNPVKTDVTGARMAGGLVWHEGALYRPAQNCLRSYGASLVLHRVLRCTPEAFDEVAVAELKPDPDGPYADGMHTLSAWGQRTLIDGKHHEYGLTTLGLKLRRRLTRRRTPGRNLP
jgi:hypothetical protein